MINGQKCFMADNGSGRLFGDEGGRPCRGALAVHSSGQRNFAKSLWPERCLSDWNHNIQAGNHIPCFPPVYLKNKKQENQILIQYSTNFLFLLSA